ncbi:hypothetical protein J3E68DRAFT_391959 [Trichoderma sp. SZMC 28012]
MQAERDMERQIRCVCDLLRTCIVCRMLPFEKIDRFDLHSLTLQGQLCRSGCSENYHIDFFFPRLLSR